MDNLKPCPFCGGKAEIRQLETGYKSGDYFCAAYEVRCAHCGIYFRFKTEFYLKDGKPVLKSDGYQQCVEAWNRRADND